MEVLPVRNESENLIKLLSQLDTFEDMGNKKMVLKLVIFTAYMIRLYSSMSLCTSLQINVPFEE